MAKEYHRKFTIHWVEKFRQKEELNPMQASSYGTGELIKGALDKGVNRILIAMGGSATVDGGCGILDVLGIEFFDIRGNKLKAVPGELIDMAKIDTNGLDERIYGTEIIVLCDVSNNLLGAQGAAAVFGPQKGASPEDVKVLDRFLENFVKATAAQTGRSMDRIKYGGAAGGASAGVYAWLGAKLANGIEYFLHLTGFDEALKRANAVITGEGSLDSQTLQGKGPYGVAVAAKKKGVKVIGLAGRIEEDTELGEYFDALICINQEPFDVTEAMKRTEENLVRVARRLGDRLA
jgi:glycerate kinase